MRVSKAVLNAARPRNGIGFRDGGSPRRQDPPKESSSAPEARTAKDVKVRDIRLPRCPWRGSARLSPTPNQALAGDSDTEAKPRREGRQGPLCMTMALLVRQLVIGAQKYDKSFGCRTGAARRTRDRRGVLAALPPSHARSRHHRGGAQALHAI